MKITPWKLTSIVPSLSLVGSIALLPLSVYGQTTSIVTMNDKSSLTIKTAPDQTYFLWQSENLSDWSPIPTYVVGDGTLKTVSIVPSEQSRMFYRFGIAPTNTLNPDDTDGDGIENSREFSLGLNPNWINSVTDLATAEVDSRISGKTATSSLRIYNNYATNGASLIFNRNSNCWINGIENISCISPWNNQGYRGMAGTLITPRHVLFCAHANFYVPANKKIYFVDDSGGMVQRTVLATLRHPDYSVPYTYDNDIVIGVLDQDVPSTIKCVKFFPNNWSDYLFLNFLTPSLRLNQYEEALVGDFYVGSIGQERAYHRKPTEVDRINFYWSLDGNLALQESYGGLYGGDSGNGGFLVIDSQLVLTNVWTFGGAGSGTSVTNEKTIINSMIGQLDAGIGNISGYVIKDVDLSKFKKLADIPGEFLPIGATDPPAIDEADYPFLEE